MHRESELRRLLGEADGQPIAVDLASVLRRSSRRRRTRQLAVGASSTFAVLGLSFAAITGLGDLGSMSSSSVFGVAYSAGDLSSDSQSQPDSQSEITSGDSARSASRCGEPVATAVPNSSGLIVTTDFAASEGSEVRSSSTVTLTNSSSERVVGVSSPTPAITLSANGRNLWTSTSATIRSAAIIDLKPGQSRSCSLKLSPVRCVAARDAASSPPTICMR